MECGVIGGGGAEDGNAGEGFGGFGETIVVAGEFVNAAVEGGGHDDWGKEDGEKEERIAKKGRKKGGRKKPKEDFDSDTVAAERE